MKKLQFAVCGTGRRGSSLVRNALIRVENVEICALSDPYTDKAEECADAILEQTGYRPNIYRNHMELFDHERPDAVLIATSWDQHIPIAIYAMERGVAVAMEVGPAYSEAECRALVETQERTGVPFMFLENSCFGKDEVLMEAMAREGVFGEIVYCHGAYMHDLREYLAYGELHRHFRFAEYEVRNWDSYPTHDLGPIAKVLNINRGNRMVSLSSRASKARGLHEYILANPEFASLKDREFIQGDIVETLITCENGELISLRLDTTLPAYYSRELTVRGTKGLYEQGPNMVYLDGDPHTGGNPTETIRQYLDNAKNYYEQYLPRRWKEITPEVIAAGHGGKDYLTLSTFCDCLRTGKEMPIDVYDAAAWMSISYLTEQSIAQGGASVDIPDFTNGAYKHRKPNSVTD